MYKNIKWQGYFYFLLVHKSLCSNEKYSFMGTIIFLSNATKNDFNYRSDKRKF